DRTRAEMDQTVDALSERVQPRHLLDDLIEYFRNSGFGGGGSGLSEKASDAKDSAMSAGHTFVSKLKRHPLSASLIAAGVTWMLIDEATDKDLEPRWTGSSLGGHGPHGKWRDGDLTEHSGSYVDARTGKP